MRLITGLYLACCVFASDVAHASDPLCRANKYGVVTTGMCADQLLNSVDVTLNEKYQKILATLKSASAKNPHFLEARNQLVTAQRDWIRFRDSDCKAVAAYLPNDPGNQFRHAMCLVERTNQRVKELDEWVQLLPQSVSPEPTVSVIEPGRLVAGQPISVWIQRYWLWQRSFPQGQMPSADNSGEKCGIRQNQAVFFLTGSAGSAPVQRKCTIPASKYVLIPVINVLGQNDGPNPIACETYLKAVRQANERVEDLALVVNGVAVEQLPRYRADSGCFHLNDASSGVSGTAAGAGYWVMLEPMKPGKYQISFKGRYSFDGFSQNVNYQIEVE